MIILFLAIAYVAIIATAGFIMGFIFQGLSMKYRFIVIGFTLLTWFINCEYLLNDFLFRFNVVILLVMGFIGFGCGRLYSRNKINFIEDDEK